MAWPTSFIDEGYFSGEEVDNAFDIVDDGDDDGDESDSENDNDNDLHIIAWEELALLEWLLGYYEYFNPEEEEEEEEGEGGEGDEEDW